MHYRFTHQKPTHHHSTRYHSQSIALQNPYPNRLRLLFFWVLALSLMMSVFAPQRAVAEMQTVYVELNPSIVVNFGERGKMRYLKTNISIRAVGNMAASAIEKHKPYLRNNLILFLSAQEEESLISSKGRETIRMMALEEVRAVLRQHEGLPLADDLLFTNFIVQK